MPPLLEVRGLSIEIPTGDGVIKPAQDVSFELERGGTLAVVGESGSGKTLTCLAVVRLLPPPGRIVEGSITLEGVELTSLSEREFRRVRGRRIGFVFQDPSAALDPVFTIGDQIVETMRTHLKISRSEARRRAINLLDELEFPEADKRFNRYPHELSGGMKQRVAIAIALCCQPDLLIADEPTTALDVTTERTILNLIHRIQEERHLALLLVTHNLAVAATVADQLCVMYAGRIVEERDVKDALNAPAHPYTEALVACAGSMEESTGAHLATIPGSPPLLNNDPDLCTFVDRCPYSDERCRAHKPGAH